MQLTCAQASKLHRLANGEALPKSQIRKTILDVLRSGGAVRFIKSGSSYSVRGIPGKLEAFVESHWGIYDLARYAEASPENRDRQSLTEISTSSKVLPTQPLKGIFIRSFNNCFLGGMPLHSTPMGTAVLITLGELPRLEITAQTLIAIENVECLWKFERALTYFPQLEISNYALVLRWHWSEAWRKWLGNWTGRLFHFPDYDSAGLRIFATEVLPFRPDARLLIPKEFDALVEHGSRALFLQNEHCFPSSHTHEDVVYVGKVLKAGRKALEQETLLSMIR